MFYNNVQENGNTRETVNQWLGYNHNYNLSDGQFYDLENLSSDCYPYLTQRKKRNTVKVMPVNTRALIQTAEGFAYLSDIYLHYTIGGQEKTVELLEYFFSIDGVDRTSKQTITKMGALLIITPANIYVNMVTEEVTRMDAKEELGIEHDPEDWETPIRTAIGYTHVDADGNEFTPNSNYQIGDVTPETAADGSKLKEGDYWFDTKNDTLMVYDADSATWMPVTTTYIRIGVYWYTEDHWDADGTYHPAEYTPAMNWGLNQKFSVGDAVYMNTIYPDINNGSVIKAVDEYSITVIGTLPGGASIFFPGRTVTIERRIPGMDYMCVSGNRLWGCRFGTGVDGKFINEIFCSKQGDPSNFFCYEGLSTDSYSVSLGDDGPFTGCIEYQGMPTFFRENMIYRLYGSLPANYQLIQINARGVQNGSDKSLCICNEYLIYKSPTDVVIFDGNKPTGISMPLGRDILYYNATAGWCSGRYYINMFRKMQTWDGYTMIPEMFVYDMDYNVWYKENTIDIRTFLFNGNGKMYGYLADGKMIGFGPQDPEEAIEEEGPVEFYAETGDMGYEYPDHKYLDRLTIRAYIGEQSYLNIEISYDGSEWEPIGTMGPSKDTKTNTFSFRPVRCDHFKLRFQGEGNVRVYTLSRTMDTGSEEHPWTL